MHIGGDPPHPPATADGHDSTVVELAAVTKTYRRGVVALDGLDLSVPTGGVFGIIGPNGCGKTTTLRVLLGLARADSGTASLLGQRVPKGLGSVRSRIGALVETPKFFPNYSGRLNLELLAGLKGVDRGHVDVVLERVDESWVLRESHVGEVSVRVQPFEAVELLLDGVRAMDDLLRGGAGEKVVVGIPAAVRGLREHVDVILFDRVPAHAPARHSRRCLG